MAILNSLIPIFTSAAALAPTVIAPDKMWHLLILNAFSFIADYGWRIVVFTLLLKLVLSPLDFYQRFKMNKNRKITERLKPTMEKLQKQYGNDKQKFSQMQMELNRKEGYSYFSSCLPMILTMVVFITLWLSMQTIAQYMSFREYVSMYDEYTYVYEQINPDESKPAEPCEIICADVVYQMYYYGLDESYVDELKTHKYEKKAVTDAGEEYVAATYNFADYIPSDLKLLPEGTESIAKVQASFLWIQNIWAADVPWGDKAILNYDAFKTSIRDYANSWKSGLDDAAQANIMSDVAYGKVMFKLLNDNGHSRTNGYLVLPILVVLLSFGTQLLSSYQQKKAGQVDNKGGMATSMKVMMFIMPAMMAYFSIQYASIFTLYMVTNSATSLIFNVLFTGVIRLLDKRKTTRHYGYAVGSTRGGSAAADSAIIHYVKGANPNAGAREVAAETKTAESVASAPKADKKKKGKQSVTTVKSGRPDPNELMNIDMTDAGRKK